MAKKRYVVKKSFKGMISTGTFKFPAANVQELTDHGDDLYTLKANACLEGVEDVVISISKDVFDNIRGHFRVKK